MPPGSVAVDGRGRNSPYTKHLLMAIQEPGIQLEEVFKRVRSRVIDDTSGKQVPWEESSLVGSFYFQNEIVSTTQQNSVPPNEVEKAEAELLFWESVLVNPNAEAFQAYLDSFPNGYFAALASIQLDSINQQRNSVVEKPRKQKETTMGASAKGRNKQTQSKPEEEPVRATHRNYKDSWDESKPVQAPQYRVGDKWVFKTGHKDHGHEILCQEVIETFKDGSFVVLSIGEKSKKKEKITARPDFSRKKMVDLNTGKETSYENERGERIGFPLYIGKKWKREFDSVSMAGEKTSYEEQFEVNEIETIKTDIGKFRAFRIDFLQRNKTRARNYAGRFWYSPTAATYVEYKPSWRFGSRLLEFDVAKYRTGIATGSQDRALIRKTQRALVSRGYNPGVVDGQMGTNTRKALKIFQRDNNLQATGDLDNSTISVLFE